jgi:hypothetical protein
LLQHTNMDRSAQLGSYILNRQPTASPELLEEVQQMQTVSTYSGAA